MKNRSLLYNLKLFHKIITNNMLSFTIKNKKKVDRSKNVN